jgi:hypothetical protein
MAVRRNVAQRYREEVLRDPMRQALDRSGAMLGGGGDSDMALCGFALGLGTGRFPELELTHLIPARRVTLEYLEGTHEGFGYSGTILTAIHDQEARASGRLGTTALKLFVRHIQWLAMGKSHAERHIRLAEERGKLAARRELQRSGYLKTNPPS